MANINAIFELDPAFWPDLSDTWRRYIELTFTKMGALLDQTNQSGIYGHQEENVNYYDQINNFHYLFVYLYNIRYQVQQEELLYGFGFVEEMPDLEEIEEEYKLNCIRKYMACLGINMMPIYSMFGLDWTVSGLDGIGYMAIAPNTTSFPNNRVS